MNLCSLFSLLAFKERGLGAIRYSDLRSRRIVRILLFGRVVLNTGFSRPAFQKSTCTAVQNSNIPIYVISLLPTLREVITYKSSTHAPPNSPRTVRVELVNPDTGGPLQVVDADGKTIPAKVIVQDSYTPATASRG